MANTRKRNTDNSSPGKKTTGRKSAAGNRESLPPDERTKGIRLPSPEQIKNYLDLYVIGQDEAKKVLSVAVYNHYKRLIHNNALPSKEDILDKSNIVMLGQTGCGKTYMIRTIARLLDVPCYIQDCTKITESGYVGSDVEECLVGLLRDCNYDIPSAERGIVVLDECDKLAKTEAGPSITRDVGGVGVQQALLKIVEGDTVGVPPMGGRKHPEQPLLYVNTTDILFIATGAFVGLENIIEKRLGYSGKIGYESEDDSRLPGSALRYVCPHDLRDYGMIPEFVGRFPVLVNVDPLSEENLVDILVKPRGSLVEQYSRLLEYDSLQLDFTPDALKAVAGYAVKLKTGARGLRSIMETVMLDTMYCAPSLKRGSKITVTSEMVETRMKQKYGRI